uniref:Uncharacterized protein n=1 Tax=Moniliophthora roreri TaxID=221103 RepID=A0A0W0FJ30_MONRR
MLLLSLTTQGLR